MSQNEIFEYYIDDAQAIEASLNHMVEIGLSASWEHFLNTDILFVGKVQNRLVMANKIAHNKKDIEMYNALSRSTIHQEEFELLSTLTFREASMVNIIKFDQEEGHVYHVENANKYIQEYKIG